MDGDDSTLSQSSEQPSCFLSGCTERHVLSLSPMAMFVYRLLMSTLYCLTVIFTFVFLFLFQKSIPNAKIGFSKAMSAGWLRIDKEAGGPRVFRKVCLLGFI